MIPTSKIEFLVDSIDRQLARQENQTITKLERILQISYKNLLTRLKPKFGATLDEINGLSPEQIKRILELLKDKDNPIENIVNIGELRDIRTLKEILFFLNTLSFKNHPQDVQDAMRSVFVDAYEMSIAHSEEILSLLSQDITQVSVNLDSATAAINRIEKVFYARDKKFVRLAQDKIVEGLLTGCSYDQIVRDLSKATNMMRSSIERIVRTESVAASDIARRETYQRNDILHVQRYTAQDKRVCGYCAARAGRIYLASEAPAVLHPNDRCFNLPWKPEWEGTVIEKGFAQKHREQTKEIVRAQGTKIKTGRAPFERLNNLPKPREILIK